MLQLWLARIWIYTEERTMTSDPPDNFDRLFPGMQLAFFEIIWPAFSWIKSIWLKRTKEGLNFYLEVTVPPPADEREDCRADQPYAPLLVGPAKPKIE